MEESKQRFQQALYSKRRGGQKPEIITCTDEDVQSNEVFDGILGMREEGVSLHQQAVLFRAGHHSDRLEVELNWRNIPFVKYGGLKFVEAAHIKDMIAFLRILENPMDRSSWFRVLQLLEGIGPIIARKLIDELFASVQGVDVLGRLLATPLRVPSPAREAYDGFRETIKACRNEAEGLPPVEVERIRRFYEPILEMRFDNPQIRVRDLEQLELIASKYHNRSEFITGLTLDPPNSSQDLAGPPLLDDDYLILNAIHSAKGLEWNVVHIIHAADGMIPSDLATGYSEEIEEERRLLYVTMTRARNTLNLFFPLRYYHRPQSLGDRHSYVQLTRFITEEASGLFERRITQATQESDPREIPTDVADASEQIGSMLSKLWD